MVRALGEEISLVGSASKRYDTDLFFLTLWVQNRGRWQADEWMSGRFSALDDEAAPTGRTDSVILNTKQWDGKFQYRYTVKSGRAARAQAGPHVAGGDGKDADGVDRDGDDGDDYEDDCWNDEDDDDGSCGSDREIRRGRKTPCSLTMRSTNCQTRDWWQSRSRGAFWWAAAAREATHVASYRGLLRVVRIHHCRPFFPPPQSPASTGASLVLPDYRLSNKTASTSKPFILVLSLSQFSYVGMDAQLLQHLKTQSHVAIFQLRDAALRWLSYSPPPQAILLADQTVTERGQESLLKKLAEYAKSRNTIVFGYRFA